MSKRGRRRPRRPWAGRALRIALVALAALAALAVALVAAASLLAFENEAAVAARSRLTPEERSRARRILAENDPRELASGEVRTAVLGIEDLELALAYAIGRVGSGGAAVEGGPGTLAVRLTVATPRNPLGRFLNVDLAFREAVGPARLERLRVGRLPLPAALADRLLRLGLDSLAPDEGAADGRSGLIRGVRLEADRVRITYAWRPEAVDRLGAQLLGRGERERLKLYWDELVAAESADRGDRSLARYVGRLGALARARSDDPVAENRAWLLALDGWTGGRSLEALVPEAERWPRRRGGVPKLRGRTDLARHFATSAALAAVGGVGLSKALGEMKEIEDSRSGSGFSFRDLAADLAGARFGEQATASAASARALLARLERLGEPPDDGDLLPAIEDLPEALSEAELEGRFERPGGRAYDEMTAEIERRILALPLYRKSD